MKPGSASRRSASRPRSDVLVAALLATIALAGCSSEDDTDDARPIGQVDGSGTAVPVEPDGVVAPDSDVGLPIEPPAGDDPVAEEGVETPPVEGTPTPVETPPVVEAPPPAETPPEETPPAEEEPTERAVYATAEGVEACSVEDINARVDFDMRDYYVYADRVPDVRLADFDDPDALIRALRVDPDVYSSVGEDREFTRLFEEGITEGFGFLFQPNPDGSVRFREVLGGSPAELGGLLRGDRLIAIDGTTVEALDNDTIRGLRDAETLTLEVQTEPDAPREIVLRSAEYRWATVPSRTIFTETSSGLRVGYLNVRSFLGTTADDLDEALGYFAEEGGIDDLIVDLRYNPGGYTDVARRLSAQIAGEVVSGEIYQIARANDDYPEFSGNSLFEAAPLSLGLPRVVALTTRGTASASEALINGLQPWIDVVVVGDLTDGKPFSSIPQSYCEKSINAMLLLRTNAAGVDVGGGIEPTCAVEDTWFVPADDARDALLLAGLDYLSTGACPTPPVAARAEANRTRLADGPTGRATSPLQHEPLALPGR